MNSHRLAAVKYATSTILVMCLAATTPAWGADTPALCGDINATGSLTPTDALQVLRKSVGQAVTLECLDFINRYGFPVDSNKNSEFSPDYLLGQAVTIAYPATVTALGLIPRTDAAGHVRLALYSSASNAPNKLVVATDSTLAKIGSQEIPVTPTPVPAGTYWIMGIWDTQVPLAANEKATNIPAHTVRYRALPFADPLPETFGASISYGETEIHYWVKVTQ